MAAAGQASNPPTKIQGMEPAVSVLCGKRVALLGESPTHGFGETLEFKDALVRRLVDSCHYNALFFESGTYDFIHIQRILRSGHSVTDKMISAAIGGIWDNKEAQSLVPFLKEKVNNGSLTLGGMDDPIGAGTYATSDMASDLVQPLQGDERSRCLAILQKYLGWGYTADAPYRPSDKAKVVACLNEIENRIARGGEDNKLRAEEDKAMIDSLRRRLARDFTLTDWTKRDQRVGWKNARERSMYLNFKWMFSQLPPHSKVIVWTAAVHAAKTLSGVSGFEGIVPLGLYIRQEFGARAFSLGFSAYSGDYAFIHQPVRRLRIAPASSLEGRAFAHTQSNAVFLSSRQLRKLGAVAARPLGTSFKSARWDRVFDGMIIIRKEHAPAWLKR